MSASLGLPATAIYCCDCMAWLQVQEASSLLSVCTELVAAFRFYSNPLFQVLMITLVNLVFHIVLIAVLVGGTSEVML